MIINYTNSRNFPVLLLNSLLHLYLYNLWLLFVLANHNGKLQATYLVGHDKVLFVDERGVGVRTDYNGVLLLDTILQTPVSKPDDIVRIEMLVTEVSNNKCYLNNPTYNC